MDGDSFVDDGSDDWPEIPDSLMTSTVKAWKLQRDLRDSNRMIRGLLEIYVARNYDPADIATAVETLIDEQHTVARMLASHLRKNGYKPNG